MTTDQPKRGRPPTGRTDRTISFLPDHVAQLQRLAAQSTARGKRRTYGDLVRFAVADYLERALEIPLAVEPQRSLALVVCPPIGYVVPKLFGTPEQTEAWRVRECDRERREAELEARGEGRPAHEWHDTATPGDDEREQLEADLVEASSGRTFGGDNWLPTAETDNLTPDCELGEDPPLSAESEQRLAAECRAGLDTPPPIVRRPKAKTIAMKRLTKIERRIAALLYPERNYWRPKTRADCANAPRPCPFVGCRHHLFLEARPNGNLKLRFPDREPWSLRHSCALDLAEQGERSLASIGAVLGIVPEMVRQIEARALASFRIKAGALCT